MKVFEVFVERKEAPVGSTADLGVWHGGLGALLGDVEKRADGWYFADGTKIKDPSRIAQAEKVHKAPPTAPTTSQRPKARPEPSAPVRPKARPTPVDSNTLIHTVVAGETVYSIARKYKVQPSELYALNDFDNDTKLSIGQEVEVPKDTGPDKAPVVKNSNFKYDLSKFNEQEKFLISFGLNNDMKADELASFLGQCAVETDNFSSLEEYGSESYIKRYEPVFKTIKGKRVQTNQVAKNVGNTKPGDGAKYKGRGYIQVTGRDNYARVGKATGLPLLKQPELLATPNIALMSALAFWDFRVRKYANNVWSDQMRITRFVTGASSSKLRSGDKKYYDRLKNYKKYKAMLIEAGVPSDTPKETKK